MHQYPSPQAALNDLENVINQLTEELRLFAARPNPSGAYIDKQNLLIQHLTGIYNGITALKHYDVWQKIETTMQRLEHQDPNIGGHHICLRTRAEGNNFALIEYNPFE